jgi:hypothetical protein
LHLLRCFYQSPLWHSSKYPNALSFADSQTNSLINRVLSANGLSNVIPTSSRKVERWDTWTNAKVVIGNCFLACFYDEYTIGAPSMFFRL